MNLRVLASCLLLLEILVLCPIALKLIEVDRHPLDLQSRLPPLQEAKAHVMTRQDFKFDFFSHFKFDAILLMEDQSCDLAPWQEFTRNFSTFLTKTIGSTLSYSLETSVMFYANVKLLESSKTKSLFQVLDQGLLGTSPNSIHLVSVCSSALIQTFEVPNWGFISFFPNQTQTLGRFSGFVSQQILRKERMEDIAWKDILQKLIATKTLAESMTYLPIGKEVCSDPFERVLDILYQVREEADSSKRLLHLQEASRIATGISTHFSLIPSLYMSNENLLAIFSPLMVPTLLPLLLGILQECKATRKSKQG